MVSLFHFDPNSEGHLNRWSIIIRCQHPSENHLPTDLISQRHPIFPDELTRDLNLPLRTSKWAFADEFTFFITPSRDPQLKCCSIAESQNNLQVPNLQAIGGWRESFPIKVDHWCSITSGLLASLATVSFRIRRTSFRTCFPYGKPCPNFGIQVVYCSVKPDDLGSIL